MLVNPFSTKVSNRRPCAAPEGPEYQVPSAEAPINVSVSSSRTLFAKHSRGRASGAAHQNIMRRPSDARYVTGVARWCTECVSNLTCVDAQHTPVFVALLAVFSRWHSRKPRHLLHLKPRTTFVPLWAPKTTTPARILGKSSS